MRMPVSLQPHQQSACQSERWETGGDLLSEVSVSSVSPGLQWEYCPVPRAGAGISSNGNNASPWRGLTPALVTHMEWTHIATCRISCSGKLSMHSLFTQRAILGLKSTTVFTGIEKEIVPLQRPAYQAFNACFPAANLISRDWVQERDPKPQRKSCYI